MYLQKEKLLLKFSPAQNLLTINTVQESIT